MTFFPGCVSFLLKVYIMSAGLLGFYLLSEYSRNLLYFFLSVCYLRLFCALSCLLPFCLFAHHFIDNCASYLVRSSSSFISSDRNQCKEEKIQETKARKPLVFTCKYCYIFFSLFTESFNFVNFVAISLT